MESKAALTALSALAQDTRLAVFRLLVVAGPGGLPVASIGDAVTSSPATLSFHLKELVRAGLISPRQNGRQIFYSAQYQHMNELLGFLTDNCCSRSTSACGPDDCPIPQPSHQPLQRTVAPSRRKTGESASRSRRARKDTPRKSKRVSTVHPSEREKP